MESLRETRRPWRRIVFPAILVGAALVHPLATVLARLDWRADLITHFTVPAMTVTLAAAAGLVRRHRRLAIGLIGVACWQALPLVRYLGANPVPPDGRSPARLRLLMANVLADNTRYAALEELIWRERPDVVGLVEVTRPWLVALASVREEYPFRAEYPFHGGEPDDNAGLALWFRERPARLEPPEVPLAGASPVIHAEIDFAGRRRHLWLVHPTMPFARRGLPEIDALAALIGRTPGPRIVIGDMNSTEGSPQFAGFLRISGLRDSRLGFGRQPSWPTDLPLRIALEHAFVSDDLAVVGRRLGPMIGSDHFPLIVDLAPAAGSLGGSEPTRVISQGGETSASGRGD
jgi:endonuclease/exonuclease/phosphatase (EEP) superfamily protein YafD